MVKWTLSDIEIYVYLTNICRRIPWKRNLRKFLARWWKPLVCQISNFSTRVVYCRHSPSVQYETTWIYATVFCRQYHTNFKLTESNFDLSYHRFLKLAIVIVRKQGKSYWVWQTTESNSRREWINERTNARTNDLYLCVEVFSLVGNFGH